MLKSCINSDVLSTFATTVIFHVFVFCYWSLPKKFMSPHCTGTKSQKMTSIPPPFFQDKIRPVRTENRVYMLFIHQNRGNQCSINLFRKFVFENFFLNTIVQKVCASLSSQINKVKFSICVILSCYLFDAFRQPVIIQLINQ